MANKKTKTDRAHQGPLVVLQMDWSYYGPLRIVKVPTFKGSKEYKFVFETHRTDILGASAWHPCELPELPVNFGIEASPTARVLIAVLEHLCGGQSSKAPV